jgi:amidophosphoribosyltransferase
MSGFFGSISNTKNGRYRPMVEQIGMNLGFTTLDYQRLEDLVSAIGLPKE